MKLLSNKTLFKIHGWLGLNIGLLLFVICFSGTFATLSNELDWLLDPALRVEGKDAPYAWEAMYQNMQKEFPDLPITNLEQQKNSFTEVGDYFAATSYVSHPVKGILKVHLDPYTGAIRGQNPFLDVQRFFRSYHNNFFDGLRGVIVVTIFAFFLLFSVLTGFLFYKNWFKNLFKLRWDKGIRMLVADAHRMAGVWSLIFALIISLTGVWYFTEFAINNFAKSKVLRFAQPEKIAEAELRQLGDTPKLVNLDTCVQKAEAAFPGYQVEYIGLPSRPNNYIVMHGQDNNPLTRDRTNQVHANPYTGEVVFIQKAGDLPILQLINNLVDPLHFGTFGGLGVKVLWFLFGLVLSISILAGTYIWYLRQTKKLESKLKKKRQRLTTQKSKAHVKNPVPATVAGISWRHLSVGRGVILSTTLILFYLISIGFATVKDGFRIWSGYPEGYYAIVDSAQLGPWPVKLACSYPCTLEEGTRFYAHFPSGGIPNYDSLYMEFYIENEDPLHIPFGGSAAQASLTINEEVGHSTIKGLRLKVLPYTGQAYSHPVEVETLSEIAADMQQRFVDPPEKIYPEVPTRVYVVAALFAILTGGILLAWTVLILRAVRKEQQLLALVA
ncbi:MAG: PepSY-associated TM helix domain-containing protein [Bacteroidota bacterium]